MKEFGGRRPGGARPPPAPGADMIGVLPTPPTGGSNSYLQSRSVLRSHISSYRGVVDLGLEVAGKLVTCCNARSSRPPASRPRRQRQNLQLKA